MSFAVSDKVVCVDDKLRHNRNTYPNGLVKKGEIYVVSDILPHNGLEIVGKPVINPAFPRVGWFSDRFRKLSDIQAENAFKRAAVTYLRRALSAPVIASKPPLVAQTVKAHAVPAAAQRTTRTAQGGLIPGTLLP